MRGILNVAIVVITTFIFIFALAIGIVKLIETGETIGGWLFLLGVVASWIAVTKKRYFQIVVWICFIVFMVGVIRFFIIGSFWGIHFTSGYFIGGAIIYCYLNPSPKPLIRLHGSPPLN